MLPFRKGMHLEKLSADRAGEWSVRINSQYRICFVWDGADAHDVEIVDYHWKGKHMSLKADFVINVHPGEILQMMLDDLGISQTRLAKHIGVTQSKISELCSGRRGISAEMAVKLGRAFGQNPRFWLDGQQRWELSRVDQAKFKIRRIAGTKAV